MNNKKHPGVGNHNLFFPPTDIKLTIFEYIEQVCKDKYEKRLLEALFVEQKRNDDQFSVYTTTRTDVYGRYYTAQQCSRLPSSSQIFRMGKDFLTVAHAFKRHGSLAIIVHTFYAGEKREKTSRPYTLFKRQWVLFDRTINLIKSTLNV